MIAQERKGGAESCAERRRDLGRVRRDHRELAVVDGEFVLELGQVPQLAPALRSPVPAVEAHDERELARERGEADRLGSMIGQLEIRELLADGQMWVHEISS